MHLPTISSTLLLSLLALATATPTPPTASPTGVPSIPGSGYITTNNYTYNALIGAENPPFCGMPYSSLNPSLITAMHAIPDSLCGTCLHICGSAGCANVLVVDQGGTVIDLATGISDSVIGVELGGDQASWEEVSGSFCAGVWKGEMFTAGAVMPGKLGALVEGGWA